MYIIIANEVNFLPYYAVEITAVATKRAFLDYLTEYFNDEHDL